MITLYMQSLIQSGLNSTGLQSAVPNALQSGLQTVAQNALQNGIQSVSTVVPTGAPTGMAEAGAPVASLPTASLPVALTSANETKTGIVQLLTELVKDKEFKQLVMEKISDPVFVSMQEKLDKSVEMTEKIRSLHAAFETAFDAAKPDEIQSIVKKFNADMKAAFENVQETPGQTGGARQKTRRPTRRKFSSRVFQRTLGRTRNFQ